MTDNIYKERRALDKLKRERIRELNDEFYPLYKEIQSRCGHQYNKHIIKMMFHDVDRYECWDCNNNISREEYKDYLDSLARKDDSTQK